MTRDNLVLLWCSIIYLGLWSALVQPGTYSLRQRIVLDLLACVAAGSIAVICWGVVMGTGIGGGR